MNTLSASDQYKKCGKQSTHSGLLLVKSLAFRLCLCHTISADHNNLFSRFLPDHESVERVRKTFTGLYTLDPVMYMSAQLMTFYQNNLFLGHSCSVVLTSEAPGKCGNISYWQWTFHPFRSHTGTKFVEVANFASSWRTVLPIFFQLDMFASALERFSIECRKTKTKTNYLPVRLLS